MVHCGTATPTPGPYAPSTFLRFDRDGSVRVAGRTLRVFIWKVTEVMFSTREFPIAWKKAAQHSGGLAATDAGSSAASTASANGVRWDLSDLFAGPDDPKIQASLTALDADAEAFAVRYRGTISVPGGPSPHHLLEGIVALEDLYERQWRVSGYAHLRYDEDTRDEASRSLSQKVEDRLTHIGNLLLFFGLEWLEVSDEDAGRIVEDPILAIYRHHLESQRLFRPHRLSEDEEKLVNEKDVTGSSAWARLHTELTSSLSFSVERDGEVRQLNMAQTLALLHDPDRDTRRRGHDALFSKLEEQGPTLTYLYDTLVHDKRTMDRLRKYPDPMSLRHLGNEIPSAAVEAMMQAVEGSYPLAQSYFKLKGSMLGLPEMMVYDQYAPLELHSQAMPWGDARDLVLESYRAIDTQFGALATEFFDRNWIDAEPRDGKRGGAYCSYPTPKLHAWILCSYTGTPRDVMTVAHELGHGLHAMLSRKQTLFNYHSTLPLAETASVFGEMVVFDRLVQRETDPRIRLNMLAGKIEDSFATVYRQNVLTRFEQSVFSAREEGRLTSRQLGDLWIAANRAYYGDSVTLTDGYRWGWSYIPHFIHTPFYCYAYVFGQLLVLALYRMYKEEGQSFVPRFTELLARGGSDTPEALLRPLGIDITDASFWQKGLVELEGLVSQAQALAASLYPRPE